jgi:hypothetical protein
MKRFWIISGGLFVMVAWHIVASDYGDSVASGSYHFTQDDQTSTLVLKPDHSFQQELMNRGEAKRATGTWHRIGEGGIEFSKEFLPVSGQEPGPEGSVYADMHKPLGLFVSLALRQYHIVWYGKVDHSPSTSVSGTYAGDEPGVSATLILRPDHTFEQAVHTVSITNHTFGTWSTGKNGDIIFSKDFIKTSGETLQNNETASAMDPKGSNLQVEIAMTSRSGVPTFRKNYLFQSNHSSHPEFQ